MIFKLFGKTICFTSFIFTLFFISFAASSEENAKPIETKQSGYWTYYCEDLQERKHCEIAQKIIIGEKKLTFLIIYKVTKNKNSNIKESFNVITPLGTNLDKRLKITFDDKTKFTKSFSKCEVFGCIALFDVGIALKHSLEKYENLKIIFYDFRNKEPNTLEMPINGFLEAFNNITQQLESF